MIWQLAAALLAVLLAVPAAGADTSKAGQTAVDFDYFVLARTWPPTLCSLEKCSQPTYNVFTIHGLWPSNYSGSHPDSCNKEWTFKKEDLPLPMRGRMSCEWRNFQTGDLPALWGSEWAKHGTCAAPLFNNSKVEYFNTTLRLHEQYDINEALVKSGFSLLAATQATASQLVGMLKKQFGVRPAISCTNGRIYEVKTCFDLQLKPTDCPSDSSCPKAAQSLPYGGPIPQTCLAYIDNVANAQPSGSPPPPPSGAARATSLLRAALTLLAAAAAALATL